MPTITSWLFNRARRAEKDKRKREEKDLQRQIASKKKARKHLEKELRKDAKSYISKIVTAYAQIGEQHEIKRSISPNMADKIGSKKKKLQRVRIREAAYNRDSIFFLIDTRAGKLPYRTFIADLILPEALHQVGHACQHTIRAEDSPECGTWLILDREGSSNRVPKKYPLGDAMKRMREQNRTIEPLHPLSITLGAAQDGEVVVRHFQEMRALLVAGEIGSGKSMMVNQAIITLASFNDPETLQFVLIDLKDGQELGEYEALPHMLRIAGEVDKKMPVIRTPAETMDALVMLRELFAERGKIMAKERCRNINEFNRLYPEQRMPFILTVVDELAELLRGYDKKLASEGTAAIGQLLATSRARGGYYLLSTQTPRREIVDGVIKANLPARMAFSVSSQAESRIAIGSSDAWALEPEGRAIFRFGSRKKLVQAPYVSSAAIHMKLKEICALNGAVPKLRREVTASEIFEWALANRPTERGAKLPYKPIVAAFPTSQIAMRELLESLEGREFDIHGEKFTVQNTGIGQGRGRELIRSSELEEPLSDSSPQVGDQAAD